MEIPSIKIYLNRYSKLNELKFNLFFLIIYLIDIYIILITHLIL